MKKYDTNFGQQRVKSKSGSKKTIRPKVTKPMKKKMGFK